MPSLSIRRLPICTIFSLHSLALIVIMYPFCTPTSTSLGIVGENGPSYPLSFGSGPDQLGYTVGKNWYCCSTHSAGMSGKGDDGAADEIDKPELEAGGSTLAAFATGSS